MTTAQENEYLLVWVVNKRGFESSVPTHRSKLVQVINANAARGWLCVYVQNITREHFNQLVGLVVYPIQYEQMVTVTA